MANTTLAGTQIANTFPGLIKTCDNDQITCHSGARSFLNDGCGNETSISIGACSAAAGILVCGASTINGNVSIAGTITSTGTNDITSGNDIIATNDIRINGNSIQASDGNVKIELAASCVTLCQNTLVNGTINATGDITAFCSSDKRLKNNIIKLSGSDKIVNKLNGYSFEWNKESGKEGSDIGVIAQEVKEVLPLAVKERQDGYLAVDYPKLIPVLIEELKRLNNEIIQLKEKIN
jgi:hypothetical protein